MRRLLKEKQEAKKLALPFVFDRLGFLKGGVGLETKWRCRGNNTDTQRVLFYTFTALQYPLFCGFSRDVRKKRTGNNEGLRIQSRESRVMKGGRGAFGKEEWR